MNILKFRIEKQAKTNLLFYLGRFQFHHASYSKTYKLRCYAPFLRLDSRVIYTKTIADRKFLKIMNEYVSAEHKLKAYCE